MAKKKSKKKQVKKTEKKVAEKKTVERDKFGSVVGSKNAQINACLSKTTPKSMHRLVKQAKLSGTYYDHLNFLVKQKLVVKSKDDKGKNQFVLK